MPNDIPTSECDPKLHYDWRSDEAIISHTKIGNYEIFFFFLHRTELELVKIQLQTAGSVSTIGISARSLDAAALSMW